MLKKIVEVLEHLVYSHTFRSEKTASRVTGLLTDLREDLESADAEAAKVQADAKPAAPSAAETQPVVITNQTTQPVMITNPATSTSSAALSQEAAGAGDAS